MLQNFEATSNVFNDEWVFENGLGDMGGSVIQRIYEVERLHKIRLLL